MLDIKRQEIFFGNIWFLLMLWKYTLYLLKEV